MMPTTIITGIMATKMFNSAENIQSAYTPTLIQTNYSLPCSGGHANVLLKRTWLLYFYIILLYYKNLTIIFCMGVPKMEDV